jgi:hypothetical protein
MAKDAAERKGVPFDEKKWREERAAKKAGGTGAVEDPLTMIKNGIKIVMTAYTEDNHPGVAKNLLQDLFHLRWKCAQGC